MILEDEVETGVIESDIELSADDDGVGILISIFCHDVQLWKLVMFGERVGIPMGTKCAPLLADLFLYLLRGRLHTNASQEKQKEASPIL